MKEKLLKKVLILEDHEDAQTWLSDAVKLAYGEDVEITVIDRIIALNAVLSESRYDLFLVDLNLPDGSGIDAIDYAKKIDHQLTCIVTTIYSSDSHLYPSLRAGASGYILKDETKESIAQMLKNIEKNIPAISAEIAEKLLSYFHQPEPSSAQPNFTEREQETLAYIAKGYSVKYCASSMNISHHTVSGYVKEIYRKLGVSSRSELTSEVIRKGILKR